MTPEFESSFDYLPIIPGAVLKKHAIHQPLDNRFRSAARLLQSIWRTDKQLPAGTYVSADGKPARLGSRISPAAARTGANFLSPEIAAIAFREVCYREIGAMIDEERLFTNLLSSMPLTFNLFGWFRLDVKLATTVLKAVIPGFTGAVTQVVFEHAPARGNPQFTEDRTAFDVLIRYTTDTGRRGFVAIEVKYSESCQEPIASIRPRYDELSRDTGLFIEHDSPYLRTNPLQQFWREHCLAQVMVSNGLYDEGYFMLVAPRLNHLVQSAAGAYSCQLNEPDEGHVPFVNVHLEDVITAMNNASAVTQAAALHRRYTDFWIIDGEIELALSAMFPKDKKEVAVPKAEKKKRKAA